jgi:hypothetical protein
MLKLNLQESNRCVFKVCGELKSVSCEDMWAESGVSVSAKFQYLFLWNTKIKEQKSAGCVLKLRP